MGHHSITPTLRLKADPYSAGHGVCIVPATPKLAVVVHIGRNGRSALNQYAGTQDGTVVTFGRAKKSSKGGRNSHKAGRHRESRILVLVFPDRFERWLNYYLTQPPGVHGAESKIATERFFGIRVDVERCERTSLIETVNVNVRILERACRSDSEVTKVQIVTCTDECAEFRASSSSGRQSTQSRTVRLKGIVATIDYGVHIKTVVPPGGVQAAFTAIDIDIPRRLQIS